VSPSGTISAQVLFTYLHLAPDRLQTEELMAMTLLFSLSLASLPKTLGEQLSI